MVPSCGVSWTPRKLPPGSTKREPFAALRSLFHQAAGHRRRRLPPLTGAGGALASASRGAKPRRRATAQVSQDVFADMERLPETADQLRAVAAALSVDPSKVLYLGRDATEQKVKSLDLSKYRFIEFATHGLLPSKEYGLSAAGHRPCRPGSNRGRKVMGCLRWRKCSHSSSMRTGWCYPPVIPLRVQQMEQQVCQASGARSFTLAHARCW